MSSEEVNRQLSHIIGDGLFPDPSSLLSFSLSLGIHHDKKEDGPLKEMPSDLTEWEVWPLVQLIIADSHVDVKDMSQMKDHLLPYLNGGLQMIIDEVGKSKGDSAVRRIMKLL